jgi:hypothetical protein
MRATEGGDDEGLISPARFVADPLAILDLATLHRAERVEGWILEALLQVWGRDTDVKRDAARTAHRGGGC